MNPGNVRFVDVQAVFEGAPPAATLAATGSRRDFQNVRSLDKQRTRRKPDSRTVPLVYKPFPQRVGARNAACPGWASRCSRESGSRLVAQGGVGNQDQRAGPVSAGDAVSRKADGRMAPARFRPGGFTGPYTRRRVRGAAACCVHPAGSSIVDDRGDVRSTGVATGASLRV